MPFQWRMQVSIGLVCIIREPPFVCGFLPRFFFFLGGLGYQDKDMVFRFIIKYCSLRAFGPLGNNRSSFI
jgi:hypothetical protein